MKVSVIIPVYNVEAYIEACLHSVLNQTYRDLEIILVDDCGQDRSMEIAREVIGSHPRGTSVSILTHEKNRGLSAARNTGIAAATGEYLYFLDSDDEISPDAIEKLAGYIEKYGKIDMVQGEHDFDWGHINPELKEFYDIHTEIKDIVLKGYIPPMAWNKLLKRSFIVEHSLFFKEGVKFEDEIWIWFLAKKIETLALCRDITYQYTYNPAGIMQSAYDAGKAESRFTALQTYADHLDPVCSAAQTEKLFKNAFSFLEEIRRSPKLLEKYKKAVFRLLSKQDKTGIPRTFRLGYRLIRVNIGLYLFSTRLYAALKRSGQTG